MQAINQETKPINQWKLPEIMFLIWASVGLLSLIPVMMLLQASFPIFTLVCLAVPVVIVLRSKDASRVGFISISWKNLIHYSALYLCAMLVLMLAFEPWSHTYQILVTKAITAPSPDPTFAWVMRYPGLTGWLGMYLFSGLVTIFAEELFFRGWLLQWLQKRMNPFWTVIVQAALFTLPQMIAALLLPPLQGVLYALVYSWLGIGVVGGWTAIRTQSIWPSLVGASTCNFILTFFVLFGSL